MYCCRICLGRSIPFMDFGEPALAGCFPSNEGEGRDIAPLCIDRCVECDAWQVREPLRADVLFNDDYRYRSSDSLGPYFDREAKDISKNMKVDSSSRILEIGSNDGPFQSAMSKLGYTVEGIDPAGNMVDEARDKGLITNCAFFSYETAKRLYRPGSFDAVASFNCFAHIEDLRDVFEGINLILKKDGVLVFEVHSQRALVESNQYDFIYHEHIYYHTRESLQRLCSNHSLYPQSIEEIPNHGGSLRVTATKLRDLPKAFPRAVSDHLQTVSDFLKGLKAEGKSVSAYGASGRANIHMEMLRDKVYVNNCIDYVVDDSPSREGRSLACGIPVVPRSTLEDKPTDVLIIFAWTYAEQIMEKIPDFKGEVWVLFPEIKKVTHATQ